MNVYDFHTFHLGLNLPEKTGGKKQPMPVCERVRKVPVKEYADPVEAVIVNSFNDFIWNSFFTAGIRRQNNHVMAAVGEGLRHVVGQPGRTAVSQSGIKIGNDKGDPHGGMIAYYETAGFGFNPASSTNPQIQPDWYLGV